MAWFLSPSGWPTFADSDEEQADLEARGYGTLADDQVQAAIDAFNAVSPPVVTPPGFALAVDVAAALALKANASSLPGKLSIADIPNAATPGGAALREASDARYPQRQPTTQLLGFYAALAARNTTPCDVVVLGDSIMEGQGATAVGRRWPDQLRDRLRDRFPVAGVTGGVGYVPAHYVAPNMAAAAPTLTGNPASTSAYGLGRRGRSLASAGQSVTVTRDCTSVAVCYRSFGVGNTISIAIDGGAPVVPAGVAAGEATWTSGQLTPGPHTIVVAYQAGAATTMEGFFFYNGDESKGIRVWEGAQYGSEASSFTAATGGLEGWADSLVRAAPDLVLVEWLSNDVATKTPAQYGAACAALVALIRAKVPNAPIGFLLPQEKQAGVATWGQYVDQAQAVADASTNVVVIDLGKRIPRLSPDTYGLLVDSLHPNDKGHALLADTTIAMLAPALQ